MLNIIFAGLMDEIMKDMIMKHEEKVPIHPLLESIGEELKRLKHIDAQVRFKIEALEELHQAISELWGPERKSAPAKEEKKDTSEKSASTWQNEKIDESTKKRGRKPKKQAEEYQHLPRPKHSGDQRRDALELALHNALERLNNTKMAFHFKTIKRVRKNLEDLFNASAGKSNDERIVDLEAGLKDAVELLSTNPNAANSKVMQNLWSDIIVALQGKDSEQ